MLASELLAYIKVKKIYGEIRGQAFSSQVKISLKRLETSLWYM